MPDFNQLMERMDDWEGYNVLRGAPIDEAAMDRAFNLLQNTDRMPPRRWAATMEEAITTSDFPLLFGGILDRQLLARYALVVPDWRAYIKVGTCKDFREKEIHKLQGNEKLLPKVAEKGEYLVEPMVDAHYHNRVYKRGRQFDISWESLINDDLGAFSDFPQRFANACIYTEAYEATNQIAVAAGPNPLLFGAPIADVDGQNVTNQGVLALTIANLEATLALMAEQTDVQGKPLSIVGKHLVVPPRMELDARAILTSAVKQWTEVGAGGGVPMPTTNVIPQLGIQLHVNPLLPVLDTSGNKNGTWYLFADLADGAAAQLDFLQGHETPEICMKGSDKVAISGAPLGPFSGDFISDNVYYRVRHVLGGAPLDPRFAYAQVHT
jgi:hypothetical protein